LLTQGIVDALKSTIVGPGIEVVADAVPVGKVFREHPPLAAGVDQIEQGVGDLTKIEGSLATPGRGRRKQRFHELPLLIS
jgi:hypothetical protein